MTTQTKVISSVIINTKSNFRNLNGHAVDVIEIVGNRVSCKIWADEHKSLLLPTSENLSAYSYRQNGARHPTPL
jgi:hypothetical protein